MLYSKGTFPNFFKGAPLVLETERGNLVSPYHLLSFRVRLKYVMSLNKFPNIIRELP